MPETDETHPIGPGDPSSVQEDGAAPTLPAHPAEQDDGAAPTLSAAPAEQDDGAAASEGLERAAPDPSGPILFGDIAIAEKMITPRQLADALGEAESCPLPIGEILLRKGYLLREQHHSILEIQASRLSAVDETSLLTLEESLFGKMVISLEIASETQVNAGIREQADRRSNGEMVRLGQVLMQNGVMTPDQVRRVLHRQCKEILFCPSCHIQYNVVGFESGRSFSCQACGGTLTIPEMALQAPIDPETLYSEGGIPKTGAKAVTIPDSTSRPAYSRTGEILGKSFGNYRIIRRVARGGMGIVYQALQKDLGRVVAIKVLSAGAGASEDELRRFHLEASAAANLNHPYIVPIHEVGEIEGRHYFTMDFIKGATLSRTLRKGGLPIRDALKITRKVAEALHYAHTQKIVHRDIKPANIIVDPFGNPRITDFGIVKDLLSDAKMTKTGLVIGTPSYMSPEQAAGADQIDGRADVYSLGAVLYELLTSSPPFRGDGSVEVLMKVVKDEPPSPRSLNPSIHRDVETICLKCLEKDPEKRYATAEELQKDIERYLNGETIRARPIGWPERIWRKILRNRGVSATVAVAAMLILAILTFTVAHKIGDERAKQEKVQGYVDHARTYMADGDLLAARQEFTNAITIDPESLEARGGLDAASRGIIRKRDSLIDEGKTLTSWGKYQAAKEKFREALTLDSKSKEASEGADAVEEMLVEEGKTYELREEAEDLLNEGLRLAKEAEELPPERASKRYVNAVILLRQSVAKAPSGEPILSRSRQALFGVLLDFAQLALRRRTFDMASFLLSEATFLEGDRDRLQALQNTLEQSRRKHEGYTDYLSQARGHLSEGDHDKAIPAIQQALQIAETEEANEVLALARYQKGISEGDARAEEEKWEEALAAYQIARQNATEGDLKTVEGRCTRAQTEVCSPLFARAKELWEEGKTDEATSLLSKVLEVDPGHRLAQRMLADLERTEQAPEGTVYIPPGMFALASNHSGRKRFVVSFYLDRMEVTNREYAEFVAENGYQRQELWEPDGWKHAETLTSKDSSPGPLGWTGGTFPEGTGDHPVTGVSWYEARAYARWRGERLPSEWEWEKAASLEKDSTRKYPWGDVWDPSLARLDTGQIHSVGESDKDESPFGVRDLGGNVSEWTVGDGITPVIKGGSYLLPLERYARCSFRGVPPPLYRSPGTGFRCVRDLAWRGRP